MNASKVSPARDEACIASPSSEQRFPLASGPMLVLYVAAAKLLLHLLTATRYGIFRDELYYLACSQHLALGYVDQPPAIALVAWIARHLFGDSLLGIRLFPALAGAALVWLTGKLAREMGAGRFGQFLAALAIFTVPFYLLLDHWLTMNAFEPLIWMGCIWCVLRAINSGDARYWFWFGVISGIGFETKYSIAFLLLAVLAGVVLTPERRFLKSRYLWAGVLACAAIALPNFLWQVQHGFPFLELMHNIRMTNRDVLRGPIAFILDQAKNVGPMLFPLWAGGLVWLFISKHGRRYRALGWTYVVVLGFFIALHGKNYYVAPIYPMLLAAGAIGFERLTSQRWGWLRLSYAALVVITGVLLAPLVCPILAPESFLRYEQTLGIQPPEAEHQNNGPLPQYFADEFGWENMVRQVAIVYHALSPEEQARTAIFANGYGEAAAVDFFGPKYGLPRAICKHNTYWIWGPRNYDGSTMIVLGSDGSGDRRHFKTVEAAGRVEDPYSRRDEHFTIWLCRGLKANLQAAWPLIKNFD